MDRTETIKILAVLKAAYPHAFKDMTKIDAEAMLSLWERMFWDDNYAEVNTAIAALISTRTVGYSPTIGEVKEQIQKLRMHNTIDESEAWALVSKACRHGLYRSVEEFEKLPAEVQRAVGSPEQIRAWASMEEVTFQSVVASNFRKVFRIQAQRDKEMAMLPSEVKQMISGITRNLLEESSEESIL